MTTAKPIVAAVSTGDTYMTRGTLDELDQDDVFLAFVRHISGDWGDVCLDDWCANDDALRHGARILSSFTDRRGVRFWIITEANRASTTILLPSEY
jgi:hypothetical protein